MTREEREGERGGGREKELERERLKNPKYWGSG
jgi:hypothetical protein